MGPRQGRTSRNKHQACQDQGLDHAQHENSRRFCHLPYLLCCLPRFSASLVTVGLRQRLLNPPPCDASLMPRVYASRGPHRSVYGPGVLALMRLGPFVGWGTASTARLPSCRRRSEEHTSELQSPLNIVCRLLLEK